MRQKVAVLGSKKKESLILGEKETRTRNSNNPLSSEEVKNLIDSTTDLMTKTLFVIGFNTGMRISEIQGITKQNINEAELTITVWDEKKDVWRETHPPSKVFKQVQLYLNTNKGASRLLFNVSKKTIERRIQKYTQEILGKKKSWHAVRHTYVTLSRIRGVDISIVAQNTGDSYTTLLKVYSSLPKQLMREIIEEKELY